VDVGCFSLFLTVGDTNILQHTVMLRQSYQIQRFVCTTYIQSPLTQGDNAMVWAEFMLSECSCLADVVILNNGDLIFSSAVTDIIN